MGLRKPREHRRMHRVGLLLSSAALLLLQGCGSDDEGGSTGGPAQGKITVVQPQEGQSVATHSTPFEITLDSTVDSNRLTVTLNSQDMTSHIRLNGSTATGHVYGMQPGSNTLEFTAPGLQGGTAKARVQFTFAPKPIEDVPLSNTLHVSALEGIVDVLVDPWGVHHIYTMEDNPDDLAFMQGYITGKQRLFQIDFFRKVAQGRLAELLGTALDSSVLDTDLTLRTLFLTHERGGVEHIDQVLAEDLEDRNPELYSFISRFAEGVSAYIEDLNQGRNGAVLPQQYRLLNTLELFGVLGPYEIEPFTVTHLLAIARLQQWQLSDSTFEEINRKLDWEAVREAEQSGAIPAGTRDDLFRSAPADPTTTLKPGEPGYVGPVLAAQGTMLTSIATSGARTDTGKGRTETLRKAVQRMQRARQMLWGTLEKPFSNNWLLAPSRTASGFAILSNDPHLSLSNPSIFHPIHGDNKSFSQGEINYSGCTFPGIPGIMLGQNERIAWGGTVAGYDVTDLYEEEVQINGDTKTVMFQGGPVAVETVYETFRVRGGDAVVIPIDFVPHHGPQVPGDPGSADPGLTPENNLTVRWTGQFITRDLDAFYGLLLAEDIDDFFEAIEDFGVGAQNWVGADVNGEIAYFPHAHIPIRSEAALTEEHPPYLPYPGTGAYEWLQDDQGSPLYLPPDQIPQARNPSRGWLSTANNDINGATLDNDPLNEGRYLSFSQAVGFREGRIAELLPNLDKEDGDLDHMKQIQGDHLSLLAERVRPYLLAALANEDVMGGLSPEERSRVEEAASHISAWDLRCETGLPDPFTGEQPSSEDVESSAAASIFFVCLNRLTQAVFDDEMSRAGTGLGTTDRAKALLHILENTGEGADSPFYVHTLGPGGESGLWDNLDTPDNEETRDEIIVQAMVQALGDLPSLMGSSNMNIWRWGEIHRLTYRLEGLGSAILAYNLPGYNIWDQLFGADTKGYPRSGGQWTVDPANYSLSGLDFRPGSGPAMRMVVELEEGVLKAYNVIPGGSNDLQPNADIFNPVQIRPDIHYGDQIPLWLANEYRPQLIFWEDATHAAESRIRFEPQ